MNNHLKYLRYLVRHKWFVFVAGLRFGAPIFRLLIHDWTKVLPLEWFAYCDYFYGDFVPWDRLKFSPISEWKWSKEAVEERFQRAWLRHIHWNKHHWQYWVLIDDPPNSGNEQLGVLPMPDKYIREMVADWFGAGRALRGTWSAGAWYEARKHQIKLHSLTRIKVEKLLDQAATWGD